MKADSNRIKVFHFHNGTGGGVLSVISNLLIHSQNELIENHVIYTINRERNSNYMIPMLEGAVSERVFYYSPKWNFHHTCGQLSRLLPQQAVIVANDWLELGMVAHMGLSNPVIHILHGDYEYYYELSAKHKNWIDRFVTVAEVMGEKLRKKIPDRVNDIYYLPFPVPSIKPKTFLNDTKALQIIFVGRLTKEKGYHILPLIEQELRQKNIEAEWHIAGEVTEGGKVIWKDGSKVLFYGQLPNEKVINLMGEMDCLVLPSLAEGMPVTLVEAMKAGLTCIVNNIPGGIQELIVHGVTGFKVKNNEAISYAKVLEKLNSNRHDLQKISNNARSKANEQFDPITNTASYEKLIEKSFYQTRKAKIASAVYGSRLDKSWIPNFITRIIRGFSSQ